MIQGRLHRLGFARGSGAVARHAAGLLAFAVVYAFFLRGITIGQVYAFGDFPPYYGTRAVAKFTGTWHEVGLGYPYIYNALPAYLGAVTALGGVLGQNLFYIALVPAGFLTFLVFVDRFVDSLPARYLAAGVYAINPLTIGEFVNGAVAALVGFVGLPLVLHYLYLTVERDRATDPIAAGAIFGATTISPWLGFWMVAPFGACLAYRARAAPRTLARLGASGVVGVLLALPSVHHVAQRAIGLEESPNVLAGTLRWNYAYTDPLLVLRLAGNRGLMASNELGYNTDPVLAIGLVIPAIGLLAWRRSDLHVYYVVAAGIVAFVVLTATGVTYPLFDAVPLFLSVRNPVKLQFPLLVCLSVPFGAGVDRLLTGSRPPAGATAYEFAAGTRGHTDRLVSAVLVGLLVLSLVTYAMPAAGAFGLEDVRGDDYYVDDHYEAVADDLDGTVLWVPYGYTTQLHLRHVQPDHVGIRSGGVAHGIPNTDYVARLYDDLAAGDPIHGRLTDLGVRYVVVESDPPDDAGAGPPRVVHRWGAPWLHGDPGAYAERLDDSDAYRRVAEHDEFTVYEVAGVSERERTVEREGLHSVVAPEEPSVEPIGDQLLRNPGFEDGLDGWWIPQNDSGRESGLVETSEGHAVSMRVDGSTPRRPLAQAVETGEGYPYQVSVDAEGDATVRLVWFDGETSPENRVGSDVVSTDATPTTVIASGDMLAVRIVPNASSEVIVREVTLHRTTYPPDTGVEAGDGVPGITFDGRAEHVPNATVVAANLDEEAARRVGADVRVVDAETATGGELIFDETYRQGVGVRLGAEDRPDSVPEDARAVTDETADGRVVDYWVVGEFDDVPVTVLYTSYDERWRASPDSEHFVASGWANGFTNAQPADVRWTGGGARGTIVLAWLGLWAATLVALVGLWYHGRTHHRRDSQRTDQL